MQSHISSKILKYHISKKNKKKIVGLEADGEDDNEEEEAGESAAIFQGLKGSKGMMNSEKCIKLLQDRLLPPLQEWFPEVIVIFQQDLAPYHTSKATMKFLSDHSIKVLPWPGNSPSRA